MQTAPARVPPGAGPASVRGFGPPPFAGPAGNPYNPMPMAATPTPPVPGLVPRQRTAPPGIELPGPELPHKASFDPSSPTNQLHCPNGHVMHAKVAREVWKRLMHWHYEHTCNQCGKEISTKDACYTCKVCDFTLCMDCATRMLPRPADVSPFHESPQGGEAILGDRVSPGDIILCGPDKWGIHHVVLSIGNLRPDPEAGQVITQAWIHEGGLPAGIDPRATDIFILRTIESTRALRGQDISWYPAKTFFARDRRTGEAWMVGDIPIGSMKSNVIETTPSPVPVKLLFHPLRPGCGGPPFQLEVFRTALGESAKVSRKWGLATALRGMRAKRESLDPQQYPDPRSREVLMAELRESWDRDPICASVAIKVWQRYFDLAAGGNDDVAAQFILRFMPLIADQTWPSAMIKNLSKCGWVMRGNLDV